MGTVQEAIARIRNGHQEVTGLIAPDPDGYPINAWQCLFQEDYYIIVYVKWVSLSYCEIATALTPVRMEATASLSTNSYLRNDDFSRSGAGSD
jgi:hypothetical protein